MKKEERRMMNYFLSFIDFLLVFMLLTSIFLISSASESKDSNSFYFIYPDL